MSFAFSTISVKQMEDIFDRSIQLLCTKLDQYATSGEQFCLKDCLTYYAVDVLGEIAFSRSFGAQVSQQSQIPAVTDHIFLGTMMGQIPSMIKTFKKVCTWHPISWLRKLFSYQRLHLHKQHSQSTV